MFELRRKFAIAGNGSPAVAEDFGVRFALIDHRLDCKAHSGFQPIPAGLLRGVMRNRRFLVKSAAQTVSRVLPDHTELPRPRRFDDGVTDIGDRTARGQCR